MEVNYGDSSVTLPAYLKPRPDLRCDRLMVDGGHDYKHAAGDLAALLGAAPCGAKVVAVGESSVILLAPPLHPY